MRDKIKDYIKNEFENEFLDFKREIYDWKNNESKAEFLKDVISLANSKTENDRYLILGVELKPDGTRKLDGIDTKKLMDSAVYQQFVTDHIEPEISIEVETITIDNNDYGIIRIFNCNNRPYLIKKQFGKLDEGFMKTRRGSVNANVTRYFLDEMYALKNPIIESKFEIYGLEDGKITNDIKSKKYDFLPNVSKEREELIKLLQSINTYSINDIDKDEFEKSGLGLTSEKKEIEEKIKSNINEFAKANDIKLNDDFFDVGNLLEQLIGIGSGGFMNISPKYELLGSEHSKEKYSLIMQLERRLQRLISWIKFLDDINDISYIELAIKEIGNTPDEEIEVNIEISQDNYIDYESFPYADQCVVDEINEKYSAKMFKPYYCADISDFRKMLFSSIGSPYIPQVNPFDHSQTKIIEGVYDYIDYNVNYNNGNAILNFTIKNLKQNEAMIFPGKILLRGEVKKIKYSIISKNSKEKIEGELKINA